MPEPEDLFVVDPEVTRRGTLRWAMAAGTMAAVATAMIVAAWVTGGGDSTPPTPTPGITRIPGSPLAGVRATDTAVRAAGASPRATAPPPPTPTPVLPTPIIQGYPTIAVPATSPSREVIDAVNRSASAYAAAVARLDESLLESVFAGQALTYYSAKVHDLRAAGQSATTTLLETRLLSQQVTNATATVETQESWSIRGTGRSCAVEGYHVTYRLVQSGGAWLVVSVQFEQTSTGAC